MRFFFNILIWGERITDSDGTALTSLEDAYAEARRFALELQREFEHEINEDASIEVTKENSVPVFTISILNPLDKTIAI